MSIVSKAAVSMVVKYPFWAELLYSMSLIEVTNESHPAIPTEATDGFNLYINIDFFGPKPVKEQVKELVHEVSHKAFLHPLRRGTRDPERWNWACDVAVNEMMVANGFQLDDTWVRDPSMKDKSAEYIYDNMSDAQKQKAKSAGGGGLMPPNRNDVLKPEMSKEQIEKEAGKMQAVVVRAAANARAAGHLPVGLEMLLEETFQAAKEPWYNHLHQYMLSLKQSTYSWRRRNARALLTHGVLAPARQSEGLEDISIFVDASGSVYGKAQQLNFFGHMQAIIDQCGPRTVRVFYFDAKRYDMQIIGKGEELGGLRVQGGGGTDFRHLFDDLDHTPSVAVVLTDMIGPFGDAPNFPVIWADIYGQWRSMPGFGTHILVES